MKNIKEPHGKEACKHFNNNDFIFSKHGKFTNINTAQNETLKLRL